MQRTADAMAIAAILAGAAGSLALTAFMEDVGDRATLVVEFVPQAAPGPEAVLRAPLPPARHREIHMERRLRVIHVPNVQEPLIFDATGAPLWTPKSGSMGPALDAPVVESDDAARPSVGESDRRHEKRRRHKRHKRRHPRGN